MIIKPIKKNLRDVFFLYSASIVLSMVFFFSFGDYLFALAMLIVLAIPSTLQWIAVGRTITLSDKGICISFLMFQRQYRWNTLITKQLVDYSRSYGWLENGGLGLELSPHLRTHRKMKPMTYCIFRHPFSYVFIRLSDKCNTMQQAHGVYTYTDLYTAKSEEILPLLQKYKIVDGSVS